MKIVNRYISLSFIQNNKGEELSIRKFFSFFNVIQLLAVRSKVFCDPGTQSAFRINRT